MAKDKDIDQYISESPTTVIPLLKKLRTFIHATLPKATEGMQYGAPVFFNANKVPVIYLYGAKKHVNFGFLKSSKLSDPDNILQGSGKPSKHIKILPDENIDKIRLRKFIKQCESITE